jgi:hypothetical protein
MIYPLMDEFPSDEWSFEWRSRNSCAAQRLRVCSLFTHDQQTQEALIHNDRAFTDECERTSDRWRFE